MRHYNYFLTILLVLGCSLSAYAQTGITVGPPRMYFVSDAGETKTQKLLVSNPSKTGTMNLTVSFNDWHYDTLGSNVVVDPQTLPTSLTSWITVMPQTFFILGPGEARELEISLTAPAQSNQGEPVHTAMLYITQTNSTDSFNEKGALVKVSVRTGIKLYHRYSSVQKNPDIEFTDYKYESKDQQLRLSFDNAGNTWTDGVISSELISQSDGSTIKLEDQIIYTMPSDHRQVVLKLPPTLKKGKYIATSTFSQVDNDVIKMAELPFTYE